MTNFLAILGYNCRMDWNTKTINTYDSSANELAEYFKGIGARVDDIQLGIKLCGSSDNLKVIEIGCGDGRDAAEIVPRVSSYVGVDPSEGLLEIARKRLPGTTFIKADALSYDYPENVDVIYAFASLLHINKSDMQVALEKASASLRTGGVYYISLKERDDYTEEVKSDQYGERMFYYYSPSIIRDLSSQWFDVVHEEHQQIGHTAWFTIALKKR
jgi:SAM-dependent methyltransferase